MYKEILPLGSVVRLKNGDGTDLLIVSRASIVRETFSEVYYDYGAVVVPQGLTSPEEVFFFNRENIDEVMFVGYSNASEQLFATSYDDMIAQTKIPRGEL